MALISTMIKLSLLSILSRLSVSSFSLLYISPFYSISLSLIPSSTDPEKPTMIAKDMFGNIRTSFLEGEGVQLTCTSEGASLFSLEVCVCVPAPAYMRACLPICLLPVWSQPPVYLLFTSCLF